MKRFRPFLLLLLLIPLVVLHAAQTTPVPHLEITGVNASQMPTVTVTANVYDTLGQPVLGLSAADFSLTGDLSGVATISKVENISDNNLPFAVVLAIDISTSMAGTPFANAKQAAHAFIQNIGPNDPVAILTFGSQVKLVQDYTTDKNVLSSVIDTLPLGGETALYQGADEAVQRAADSPTPRRAVILLSDGAEYGSISHVGRTAAADDALKDGVPVYTIGVGFGIDRSYLDQLSSSTNAKNYESPTSSELTQIYTDLAAKLRSQYVVTLNVPLPLDGTQYNLGLEVKTPQGTADATAVLRAPIPVPIVCLPDQKDPIAQSTDITTTILHDDPLQSVTFQVNGRAAVTAKAEEPYVFTVNPVDYPPGSYILTVTATDTNGDTGTGTLNFTVAPLPSQISLTPDLASLGAIAKAQMITVNTSGQTDATAVSVDFNHSGQPTDLTAPYSFTIDPLFFVPGDNSVTVSVTNAGGVTSSQTFPFTIAPLPPQITIVGLQDGQSISAPVKFTIQTTSQEDITQISAKAGSTTLQPASDGSFTIDPMTFAPGATALTVSATTVSGHTGTAQVNFIVAPLPPQIIVHGLTAGETLTADRDVTLDFVTQTPVIHVAFFVDGQDLAHEVHPPYGITIGVLDYAPGDHNLRMIADDADGQSSTLDLPFTIAPQPAATATAAAMLATQGAVASATQQSLATAAAVQATQSAHATATQVAQASATAAAIVANNASATAVAVTATQAAQVSATAAARVAAQAAATQAAQASATQKSILATATQQAAFNTQATATSAARATQLINNLATLQAQITATAQVQATTTAVARATQVVADTATSQAQVSATAQAQQATVTEQAILAVTGDARSTQQVVSQGTGTAVAQATANSAATSAAQSAQATGTAQVIIQAMLATQSALQSNATATSAANATQIAGATATQIAQATQSAQATTTQIAGATATQAAQATVAAQATIRSMAVAQAQAATRDALSTANAQARLSAQATQDTRATRNAAATATDQANATATVLKATNETFFASATQLALEATQTQAAPMTATAAAQQTLSALEATATQIVVEATATRHALETQAVSDNATATRIVSEATAIAVAHATSDAQETLAVVATANRSAQLTMTAQQIEIGGTVTAAFNATNQANAQATESLDATATVNAQATIDTRLTAVGPTATPINSSAQNAGTPQPIPTLTEVQAQEPPASANVAPVAIVVIVIIVLIVVLVLIMRGRGAPKR